MCRGFTWLFAAWFLLRMGAGLRLRASSALYRNCIIFHARIPDWLSVRRFIADMPTWFSVEISEDDIIAGEAGQDNYMPSILVHSINRFAC